MSWLTKSRLFWDEVQLHGEDDYLKRGGEVVTNTTAGEAAF